MKEFNIIVFGDDFHNTYGVIRSLGEEGMSPYFINVHKGEHSFVEKSKYIRKTWRVGTPTEGVKVLKKEFANSHTKTVVICTSDPTIHEIDVNYEELSEFLILPNANNKQGEITRLMDKNVMRIYAEEAGFDLINNTTIVPLSYTQEQIEKVNYPCLVKPTNSLDGTKNDIRKCINKQQLKDTLKELSTHNHHVEIQDYIEKEVELLIMGCVLRSGEVVMPLFLGKKREDPCLEGSTAWSLCTPDFSNFNKQKMRRFFDLINYRGIFSLEYLVKGDKLYFLEINLRNDGNGYSPTFGGVNLPYLWAMDAVGEDMSQYPRIITKSFHAQVESTDFSYLKKNPTKILSWLIDTVRTECYMVANKKDIEPWNEIVRHKNIFIKYPYKLLYKLLLWIK